jgi:hypothetical protein
MYYYRHDLAHIHDQGHGQHADRCSRQRSPARTSPILASSAASVNGFWIRLTPSSRTPRVAGPPLAYPDMNKTFTAGWKARTCPAA